MAAMNVRRILVGGLIAGLALNILHALGELLIAAEMQRMFERLAVGPAGGGAMIAIASLGFVVGIVGVWLYAALQPRFGPGTATALLTGAIVWLLLCLIPNTTLLSLGIITPQLFWLSNAADFVVVPLGIAVGARVYRDAAATWSSQRAGAAMAGASD